MPPSVSELLARPDHAAALHGAARVGEAADGGRVVRVGLWFRGASVERARFRATSCAALIAYAEAACCLAERDGAAAVEPRALRAAVRGVHPLHRDRADLVALAFARALGAHLTGASA